MNKYCFFPIYFLLIVMPCHVFSDDGEQFLPTPGKVMEWVSEPVEGLYDKYEREKIGLSPTVSVEEEPYCPVLLYVKIWPDEACFGDTLYIKVTAKNIGPTSSDLMVLLNGINTPKENCYITIYPSHEERPVFKLPDATQKSHQLGQEFKHTAMDFSDPAGENLKPMQTYDICCDAIKIADFRLLLPIFKKVPRSDMGLSLNDYTGSDYKLLITIQRSSWPQIMNFEHDLTLKERPAAEQEVFETFYAELQKNKNPKDQETFKNSWAEIRERTQKGITTLPAKSVLMIDGVECSISNLDDACMDNTLLFPYYRKSQNDWIDLEKKFGPSTFRDNIRTTRLVLKYLQSKDTEEVNENYQELSEWIISLNDIQRDVVATKLSQLVKYLCFASEESKVDSPEFVFFRNKVERLEKMLSPWNQYAISYNKTEEIIGVEKERQARLKKQGIVDKKD